MLKEMRAWGCRWNFGAMDLGNRDVTKTSRTQIREGERRETRATVEVDVWEAADANNDKTGNDRCRLCSLFLFCFCPAAVP